MEEHYTVLNPCGQFNDVMLAPLSPRPADYSGKTVWFVLPWADRHGFDVVISGLERFLTEKYPGIRIVTRARGSYSSDDPQLWAEMRRDCDAFVYFAAPSCSTTAYAVTWPARALERTGVPGCVVLYTYLEEDALMSQEREGMKIRYVKTPYPCDSISADALDALLEDIDTALTAAPAGEELQSGIYTPKAPERIAFTGTYDEVQDYFYAQKWTDGLPIVPPTEERVAAMLRGTSHAPEEVICTEMAPEGRKVTVEKAAVVAVMAGAEPAYFPVILAMIEIMGRSQRYHATSKSTNAFSYMQVVNGPIRDEIGMNSSVYALGAGNKANAVLGRAHRLALTCLGGSEVGVNLMGVMGNVSSYTFAFAENEESSPWSPLSVRQGFQKDESVLTIFVGGFSHSGNYMLDPGMERMAAAARTFEFCNGFTLLCAPKRAADLAAEGYDTREKTEHYLWELTHCTKAELKRSGQWGRAIKRDIESGGGQYDPAYLDAPDDAMCAMYWEPEITVVCVGDPKGTNVMQAWHMSHADSASIDKWR